MSEKKQIRAGMIYATLAYLGWGFFPIYWKFLKHIPLLQILAHRVLWAFIFYTLILVFRTRKFFVFKPNTRQGFVSLALGASLLMGNWLVYIYAVNSNQIGESLSFKMKTPIKMLTSGLIKYPRLLSTI